MNSTMSLYVPFLPSSLRFTSSDHLHPAPALGACPVHRAGRQAPALRSAATGVHEGQHRGEQL